MRKNTNGRAVQEVVALLRRPALALAAAMAAGVLAAAPASGAPDRTPPRGGTVVYGGNFGEPACLNPQRRECIPGSSALTQGIVGSAVLDSAFDLDAADFSFRPALVTRGEVTRSRPFTVTYHIHPDAHWSDGVPVTARDFVFSVQLARKAETIEGHWLKTRVRATRTIDSKTVQLVLRSKVAGWRDFGVVFPAHALAGAEASTFWRDGMDNPRTGAAIGSGPFLVERWERGKQIVLRRNPNYWGVHPAYLDRIVVRFATPATSLVDLFRSSQIDMATHMAPSVASTLEREAGIKVLRNQRAPGWDHLEFRVKPGAGSHPALESRLVRRALAYGIDRGAITDRFLKSSNPNALPRQSAVFPEQSPYYRRNWEGYRHRPAEARRLLEQAGCSRSANGLYECMGRPLSLRVITTLIPGGFRDDVVELIQEQLRAVGVQIVPQYAPNRLLFDQIMQGGSFDVALFAWVTGPDLAAAARALFSCGGAINWTGYCQRLLTEDLDQAERILDPAQQGRVLNRVDAQIARDVPVLPLYQQTQAIAVRASVRNVGLSLLTQVNPLWNAENWWLDR